MFSPEEVWALVRAAGSEQDAAIFSAAAFTGVRMGELLALRWRDADFAGATIRVRASYAAGQLTTPKSGKVRAVPMAPDVASALAQVGRRENWVGGDDLVFAGELGGVHVCARPLVWRLAKLCTAPLPALSLRRPSSLLLFTVRRTSGTWWWMDAARRTFPSELARFSASSAPGALIDCC